MSLKERLKQVKNIRETVPNKMEKINMTLFHVMQQVGCEIYSLDKRSSLQDAVTVCMSLPNFQ